LALASALASAADDPKPKRAKTASQAAVACDVLPATLARARGGPQRHGSCLGARASTSCAIVGISDARTNRRAIWQLECSMNSCLRATVIRVRIHRAGLRTDGTQRHTRTRARTHTRTHTDRI
jgi:hypothetical protein